MRDQNQKPVQHVFKIRQETDYNPAVWGHCGGKPCLKRSNHTVRTYIEQKSPTTDWPSSFIPSHVSGQGYKIGPVCVCVSVSVSQRSPIWTIWLTDSKFDGGVDLDNISYKLKGQGYRSKDRAARLKNVVFGVSDEFICATGFCNGI